MNKKLSDQILNGIYFYYMFNFDKLTSARLNLVKKMTRNTLDTIHYGKKHTNNLFVISFLSRKLVLKIGWFCFFSFLPHCLTVCNVFDV
jgi:hypothetical protein